MEESKEEDVESRLLEEEYRIWKKNAPFLYDCVLTHALEWPSLTVQWLPEVRRQADRDVSEHKLILGTQSDGQDPNYLMIAEVSRPYCLPACCLGDVPSAASCPGGDLLRGFDALVIGRRDQPHRSASFFAALTALCLPTPRSPRHALCCACAGVMCYLPLSLDVQGSIGWYE